MEAKEILSKMTINEKLMLTSGKDFWHLMDFEKYGINSVMVTDGPHGLRKKVGKGMGIGDAVPSVAFPTASASACSWDKELLGKMGKALGEECIAEQVSVILGPGVNMKRSPLCGRNFEYFSEDPVLAGEMAAALINGVQKTGVGTSVKHFAANNQESFRMTGSSNVDDRALREYYLQPFEIAVKKSQPYTIMAAYNRINGVASSGNKWLLKDVLRKEWGYNGTVLTDWGGGHCHYEDINGGLDLEMPGNKQLYLKETLKAYKKGLIKDEDINRAALNVLNLILKTQHALTDNKPYDVAAHHQTAKEVALGSIVLLKNDKNLLPLKKGVKPYVIGEMAEKPRYQGAGSSHLVPQKLDTFLGCLDNAGIKYDYERGYNIEDVKDESFVDAAINKIDEKQPVLLFIGLTDAYESEGNDRFDMLLPENHINLVNKVLEKTKNVIVVLSGGSPVELPFEKQVPVILNAYLSGEAGADALLDIITGSACPSGRLAETWPLSANDAPCSDTYHTEKNQVNYRESIFVGYRYYNTANIDVQYPFGYGLSYTTFKFENLVVNGNDVKVDVTNTGKIDGATVVELYMSNQTKANVFASAELRNFEKVFVKAGETKTVSFKLVDRDFQYFSIEKQKYVIAAGKYQVQIGSSSRDIVLTADIEKDGEKISEIASYKNSWYTTFKGKPTDADFAIVYKNGAIHEVPPVKGNYTLENTAEDVKASAFGGFFYKIMLMAVMPAVGIKKSEANLPQNKMMIDCALNISFRGMAAMSGGIMPIWLAQLLVNFCNGFSKKTK